MTNWEKSCVDALVTSPTALALFKAKQKNKKHIDQYINKIWPYEIKKEFESNIGSRGEDIVKVIKKEILYIIKNIEESRRDYDVTITLKNPITVEDARNLFKSKMNNSGFKCNGNDILDVNFISNTGDQEGFRIQSSSRFTYLEKIHSTINRLSGSHISKVRFTLHGGRENQNAILIKFLDMFKEKPEVRSKYKKVYKGQNVGIEIEYEGIWQKYLEGKLNKSKHAVSFNSGIDGGSTDGSPKNYLGGARLRENRLRINGHRGLNALHYLLEDMIKSGCVMTNKSGMHYHIDLTHKDAKQLNISLADKVRRLTKEYDLDSVARIFEMKPDHNLKSLLLEQSILRFPTEFTTIEWRMGTPTLNFTKLTIQILCAIHVTNVIFSRTKTIDVEYLKHLADIYKQINS